MQSMQLLQIIYRVTLLPQYMTISLSFLLLLTFSRIPHVQNETFLKEIGISLIKKILEMWINR